MEDSRAYFARRAAEEGDRADKASDPVVASAHRQIHRAYLERASVGDRQDIRLLVN